MLKFEFSSEKAFRWLLIWMWSESFIARYLRAIILRVPIIKLAADWVIPFVTLLLFALSVRYILKKNTPFDLLFGAVIGVLYVTHIFIYPQNAGALYSYAPDFWYVAFPMYFLGVAISDQEIFKMLYRTSVANLLAFFIYDLIFGVKMSDQQVKYSGAMGLAYALLPHILMVAIMMFDRYKVRDIILFVIFFVYLVFCGTRGAIICALAFLLLYSVLLLKSKKRWYVFSVATGISVLFAVFFDEIIIWFGTLAEKVGMSTRILSLSEMNILSSSGRDVIAKELFGFIRENPLFGYGLAGDVALIGRYSHNFVIEMWISFGVVVGTVIFAAVLYLLIKGYRCAPLEETKKIILLLGCSAFLKLFLSSTFFKEDLLFFLLGLCIAQIRLGIESGRNMENENL